MRLFIAFEVPENIKGILQTAQDKLIFDGKATKVKDFHLTLKFLGDVDGSRLSSLTDALSEVRFDSFKANLSATGVFPDKKNPKVVWVGLEPHDIINKIRKQIEDATTKIGLPSDSRFHPHLTLARIKFVNNNRQLNDCIESIKVPEADFQINSFKLISSTLTPQGPVYEVLKSFKSE